MGQGAGVDVDTQVADDLRGRERASVVLYSDVAVLVAVERPQRPGARAYAESRTISSGGHRGDPGAVDVAESEQFVHALAVRIVSPLLVAVDG